MLIIFNVKKKYVLVIYIMPRKKQTIGSMNSGKVKVLGGTNNLSKEVVIGMVHH